MRGFLGALLAAVAAPFTRAKVKESNPLGASVEPGGPAPEPRMGRTVRVMRGMRDRRGIEQPIRKPVSEAEFKRLNSVVRAMVNVHADTIHEIALATDTSRRRTGRDLRRLRRMGIVCKINRRWRPSPSAIARA